MTIDGAATDVHGHLVSVPGSTAGYFGPPQSQSDNVPKQANRTFQHTVAALPPEVEQIT